MHTNDMVFPLSLVTKIIHCVEDAVGDDIRADIQRNNLKTINSVPSRIWDLLNTKLIEELETEDCTVATSHRGPWEMVIIFEKTTKCIFTFMRKKRFSELQRKQRNRKNMHYVDMLALQFNKELLAEYQQTSMFPNNFADVEELAELVKRLLYDLRSDVTTVRHHVLVLFETVGYQLTHIKAIKVTPNLDIARGCEQDWSKYITPNESLVVEKVTNSDAPENKPNRGLKLKPKATERQKSKPHILKDEKEGKKES